MLDKRKGKKVHHRKYRIDYFCDVKFIEHLFKFTYYAIPV